MNVGATTDLGVARRYRSACREALQTRIAACPIAVPVFNDEALSTCRCFRDETSLKTRPRMPRKFSRNRLVNRKIAA